ncbi:WG repeat-containing protein [Candidatus Poribacteria bacterium]|jgi:hypothetical protein|nr:WG repeat-containing protein [Candidatus Poribacteria bacterium]MBT5534403.1 WG repeat-containing protein [Candidatus Poribacteria bacterium]MBT5709695.1 WG repeat-containing protein [Candidatus Poribacteria bacterium]MBT7804332.1 WG repeat-containing protein [Candidatus Poribacteria bacterium]
MNKSQEWVIPPAYETEARGFHEGHAAVEVDGKCGFINTEGDVVVEPRYDHVWPFSEGLAAVLVDGVWGFVNATGDMVIEPRFVGAWAFHEGRCAARIPPDSATRSS